MEITTIYLVRHAETFDESGIRNTNEDFQNINENEILSIQGEEKGKRFAESFDITSNGNFEGVNILNLLKSNDLESDFSEEIHKLYDYRKKRTNLQGQ